MYSDYRIAPVKRATRFVTVLSNFKTVSSFRDWNLETKKKSHQLSPDSNSFLHLFIQPRALVVPEARGRKRNVGCLYFWKERKNRLSSNLYKAEQTRSRMSFLSALLSFRFCPILLSIAAFLSSRRFARLTPLNWISLWESPSLLQFYGRTCERDSSQWLLRAHLKLFKMGRSELNYFQIYYDIFKNCDLFPFAWIYEKIKLIHRFTEI